jgi:uncharacterized membrane protein YhaH (DUF805 family)
MGAILHFLFSFDGRISRTKWWLSQGIFVLLVLGWIVVSFGRSEFGAMVFGTSIISSAPSSDNLRPAFTFEEAASGFSDVAPDTQATEADQSNKFWLSFLVLAWPYCWIWLAVTAKRLHDLGMSGWWGVPGFAPTMFVGIVFVLSDGFTDFVVLLQLGPIMMILQWVQRISGVWLFSQCGFRSGSSEANQYGPPDSAASHAKVAPDVVKNFDREDQAIRAAIARMSAPPPSPVSNFISSPQKPVFGRRS